LVGNVVGIGSLIPTNLLVGNVVGNATFPKKIGPIPTKYFVGNKENFCSFKEIITTMAQVQV
jgi:hypothetical protein